MAEKKKDDRSKIWVFIGYPESLPEDWQTRLRGLMIDAIISPLHDKDVNPDGERKKPHYHIMLRYSSNKSFKQVSKDIEQFNCPAPQKVSSTKGQVRYLVHADNPEKAQYNVSDLVVIGGWDITSYFTLTQEARYDYVAEMMDFIDDNNITEFNQLLRYARKERRDDWYRLLVDNSAYVIDKYICSIRNEQKDSRDNRLEADKEELLKIVSQRNAELATLKERLKELES